MRRGTSTQQRPIQSWLSRVAIELWMNILIVGIVAVAAGLI